MDYNGDQYTADFDSRYPIFSDVNNNDFALSKPHSYNGLIANERRSRDEKHDPSAFDRLANMLAQLNSSVGVNAPTGAPAKAPAPTPTVIKTESMATRASDKITIQIDTNTFILLFIFIVLIFLCYSIMNVNSKLDMVTMMINQSLGKK